jgi:L(+)-tartrate dehydratase beta subunit
MKKIIVCEGFNTPPFRADKKVLNPETKRTSSPTLPKQHTSPFGAGLLINTPVTGEAIADLRAGDIFYLTGTVATGRDDVHRRVVHEGMSCPFDFRGLAIFHAGPIVKESAPSGGGALSDENGQCELISIGPTSSIRMEEWAADFIAKTGVKIMIGKGGMGNKTAAACREHKAIHCVYPGGCAVLGATQIEKITGVYWRELGMPECVWVMQAREFGPLMVSIDTQGNNIFAENAALYASHKAVCMKPIIESLRQ